MITKAVFINMCNAAAGLIRENEAMLGELDSHGGDGDHGATIVRAMGCMEKAIADNTDANLKDLLTQIGWGIMGVDGGATGPLFGTFFMSMSPVAEGKDALDAADVAAAFEAALAGIGKRTKAKPGDKTMVDAITPGIETIVASINGGDGIPTALAKGAEAAKAGAASTKDMVARFGRAKNVGDASKGFQDAGATSASLMFQGFADALA